MNICVYVYAYVCVCMYVCMYVCMFDVFCFPQMAYESLALISTSLSRLDCGQLGICRLVVTLIIMTVV